MNWRKVKIDFFLKERGERLAPVDANKSGLKRIEKIDFSGNIHIIDSIPTRTSMIVVKKGDLLISGINAEKGAIAIYNFEEASLATIHYSSYIYDPQKIEIEFLKWFLKSSSFKKALIEQSGNGIKSELKAKQFLALEIRLPSLKEQIDIVRKINAVIKQIEEIKQLAYQNETLIMNLRQSVLRDAFEGKLSEDWRKKNEYIKTTSKLLEGISRERDENLSNKKKLKIVHLPSVKVDEVPYKIPNSWRWVRFGNIATIASNLVKPKDFLSYPHVAPDSIEKGTGKLLSYNTIEEDKVISPKHLFFPGQILYSKIRPHLNKVIEIEFEGLCSADMYPIYSHIENKFLFRFMLSPGFVEQAKKVEGRVAMPKINQSELSMILVPVAPIEEQKEVIRKVESLYKFIDQLSYDVRQYKNESEKIIHAVLSKILNEPIDTRTDTTNRYNPANRHNSKYNSKTIFMELVELLENNGKLHAEDLWKMSKFYGPKDEDRKIDEFYAELKVLIEIKRSIKEVENEKGYLELV